MPDETLQMWTDKASEVNAALADTTDELHQVANKLDLTHRLVRSQRFMMIALIGVLILTLALAVWNRSTFNAIRDCTTPGGKCYERNAKATGEAIKIISADTQRQHDKLSEEIRTGTTSATTTTSAKKHRTGSPVSASNSSPGTTSAGTSTTTKPKSTTTTTTKRTQSTTTTTACRLPMCLLKGN